MIRFAFMTMASAVSLSACASGAVAAPPNATWLAATLLAEDGGPARSVPTSAPRAPHGRLAPSASGGTRTSPVTRIEAANKAAVHEPSPDSYVGAVQVYPWSEGAIYRLYTAPSQVSDIALRPAKAWSRWPRATPRAG